MLEKNYTDPPPGFSEDVASIHELRKIIRVVSDIA